MGERFTTLSGVAAPYLEENVSTGQKEFRFPSDNEVHTVRFMGRTDVQPVNFQLLNIRALILQRSVRTGGVSVCCRP